MKIAMMTNNYKPFIGGVPISVERLSEGLRKLGHEVCIFAPEYEGVPEEPGVVRYRSCAKQLTNGMAVPYIFDKRIGEIFAMEEFDLIHVHQPMLVGNAALHYKRKYGIPVVYTCHTRYEEYLHYLPPFTGMKETDVVRSYLYKQSRKAVPGYVEYFTRKCDLVFAPSRQMRDHLAEWEMETTIRVLPTGLADASYEVCESRNTNLRKKYLGDRKYLLCTVSRVEKEKNLYFLLDAVKELQKQMGEMFRLLIVGDGKERAALEQYAKSQGIGDTVIFAGAVPNEEVRDYLGASDLFVFASKSETQGIVLAEAMAAGLPVAAVRACGVNDIVTDGKNGRLVDEDIFTYACGVREMLEKKACYLRYCEGARKTAENYRAEYIAAQAEEAYQMVLEKERRKCAYGYEAYGKNHAVSSLLRLFKAS